MITITKDKLRNLLNKHFPVDSYSPSIADTFSVDKNSKYWNITHANMYNSPSFNTEGLINFCNELGTLQVNNADDINNSGCETCDYGSEYGFVLSIPLDEVDIVE